MILQELFEASTFRKRSTSAMTYGFEFEVIADDIEEDFDEIVERLMEEYPLEYFINNNFNRYIKHMDINPRYGFVSKEDLAEYNSEKNLQEAKLVQEILNLKDDDYKIYYLQILTRIRNNIKIDNISDLDKYLNQKYSTRALEDNFENIKNMKHKDSDRIIKNSISNDYLYFSDLISNNKTLSYIYDENGNILELKNIKLSQLEDLFEDWEDIIYEFEQEYNEKLSDKAYDELNENNSLDYVEELLRQNNITNVKVKFDESLGNEGAEIVTNKIYETDEAIKQFKKIISFIQNQDELYTNSNTGLHVNIGTWDDISQIDLTKLLVFSNETQILKNMDRQNNEYTKSLVKYVIEYLQNEKNFKDYSELIKDMNKELLLYANHTSFMDFKKLKNNGYIEIRGFGNENYEYKSDYIIKMIQYLSRLMEIASNPDEAKQQYIKKLYKIFDLDSDLYGENQENISNNSVLTNDEISTILRFVSSNDKTFYEKKLKNSEKSYIFVLRLIKYENQLTNRDLKILYKLFKDMDISKEFYEKKLKGKSEKIDNLFQNYILKGKA